jgi:hypothetical protein
MSATQTSPVEKLADDAIKKRIAAIGRLIQTRAEKRDDLQTAIDGLVIEKATLIRIQIDRLKDQLPQEQAQE